MMFKRDIRQKLRSLAKRYPVVTVNGPRQSGKTTLVRSEFPDKPYVNLEDLDVRAQAKADPSGFLRSFPDGAILDEIQQAPELLSSVQVIVDEADREGMFILTGSLQVELHQAVSQSLAGRTAILTLLPMSLNELEAAGFSLSREEALLMGGYPRIFAKNLDPSDTYGAYVQTYLERGFRQLIAIKDLLAFQTFLKLCAGRIGRPLNMNSLSNAVGVSAHTISHWIGVLEASFLVVRLPAFSNNLRKRLVKSAKLYFTDVGVACYLLGLHSAVI